MRVQAISIQKSYSGNGYVCHVTIDGEYGEMKLKLDDERTQAVIGVVADLIVDGAKNVANNLTKQALDHKAIEHKVG